MPKLIRGLDNAGLHSRYSWLIYFDANHRFYQSPSNSWFKANKSHLSRQPLLTYHLRQGIGMERQKAEPNR